MKRYLMSIITNVCDSQGNTEQSVIIIIMGSIIIIFIHITKHNRIDYCV